MDNFLVELLLVDGSMRRRYVVTAENLGIAIDVVYEHVENDTTIPNGVSVSKNHWHVIRASLLEPCNQCGGLRPKASPHGVGCPNNDQPKH